MQIVILILSFFTIILCNTSDIAFMPSRCEICALTAIEFNSRALRVHKRLSSEFANIIDNFCNGFNQYKIHKEKTGLQRFSREPSKTIETLRQMRDKGVKVELGMPYEMWDQPTSEIVSLRQGCESIVEEYEDIIEDWFLHKEHLERLLTRLCIDEDLKKHNSDCISSLLSRHDSEL